MTVALDSNGMKSLETVQVSLFVISNSNFNVHEFNNECTCMSLSELKPFLECEPGYFGLGCRSYCTPPSYGVGCQLSCTQCSNEECHPSWGCPRK